jgi:hypothetical protein
MSDFDLVDRLKKEVADLREAFGTSGKGPSERATASDSFRSQRGSKSAASAGGKKEAQADDGGAR